MKGIIDCHEEDYSEKTKKASDAYIRLFETWRGEMVYSEDLVSSFVHCFLKGSVNVSNCGRCEVCKHKASSTRTMVSHLLRYLKTRVGFSVSEYCRDAIYRFIAGKEKKEPVSQANIFAADDIRKLFQQEDRTMPQLRDKLIFAFGVCTLARSSELSCLRVEDLTLGEDGIMVSIHRKKACASRSIQTIWVCGSFFDWNLLEKLKEYLGFIPSEGPLWRALPAHPKGAQDYKPLAASSVDCVAFKMAVKLEKPNPSVFHSHSLRRTGATLLALAGRTEEDIMSMGNWTSSSAAKRYIEDSMLTKRKNGEAISIPGFTKSEIVTTASKRSDPPKSTSEDVETKTDEEASADPSKKLDTVDPVTDTPVLKRARYDGISFNGAIHQIVVVSGSDAFLDILKK